MCGKKSLFSLGGFAQVSEPCPSLHIQFSVFESFDEVTWRELLECWYVIFLYIVAFLSQKQKQSLYLMTIKLDGMSLCFFSLRKSFYNGWYCKSGT